MLNVYKIGAQLYLNYTKVHSYSVCVHVYNNACINMYKKTYITIKIIIYNTIHIILYIILCST